MEQETIIKEVLFKLDNWVVENIDKDGDLIESSSLEYDDMDFNKKVTNDEILHFYDVATNYALSYTQLTDFNDVPISDTALILWTAGLLWRKYDVRPNDQIDETYSIGYGDSLIIQAKEMLKPFKKYNFNIF
ncbi:hypothetical protein [uncultured Methanobrevibacter sp.]|uniref:hypothetical protein n=1 Tax=uncultured Methanobrevibacter sp. TaxID=253161 RepID=UPI0025E7B1B7|nr:hypothetical protein [uncultured Methanobrevibacter sp.]